MKKCFMLSGILGRPWVFKTEVKRFIDREEFRPKFSVRGRGPYPASTDSRITSVGTVALQRFIRPLCYQDFPDAVLPTELRTKVGQKYQKY